MNLVEVSFEIDGWLWDQTNALGVDVGAAAADGVKDAIRQAMVANDIAAYQRMPEVVDPVWEALQEWSD